MGDGSGNYTVCTVSALLSLFLIWISRSTGSREVKTFLLLNYGFGFLLTSFKPTVIILCVITLGMQRQCDVADTSSGFVHVKYLVTPLLSQIHPSINRNITTQQCLFLFPWVKLCWKGVLLW